jgi:large subunit ribosomal protein L24
MAHIKKNDKVKVISGKNKGREGKVLKVDGDKMTAIVERINFVKRHTKPGTGAGQHGGIVEKEAGLKLSKLMVVCPKCAKPSRTGRRTLDDGTRVRYCKRCSELIDS